MQVREAMTKPVLIVGPDHTLRQLAELMGVRRVGSAVVVDPEAAGVGIITERDVLYALGAGQDPDAERVSAHLTREVVYALPDWALEHAATVMAKGGFRHLVVMEGGDVLGVISVRDLMRVWVADPPRQAGAGAATSS